jgi:hypothetical protein
MRKTFVFSTVKWKNCQGDEGQEEYRDDNVLGDVLKLLGEGDLKRMTQLINNIHETGEWSKDFTEVTLIALKGKPKATKRVSRIRRRRIEIKLRM